MTAPSRKLAFILAALSSIGPFAIDTYLPAFHVMETSLGASRLQIQQTLTIYMLTFSFMVLWHGALADRYGRRRVLLISTALFGVASLVCALAPTVEWLWTGRALQGLSAGAGMVVGRAVIRDVCEGAQAQRLMARVMMIFSVAPALAPIVGGLLLAVFEDWRSIFHFMAVFGLLLSFLTWRFLPETLSEDARQPLQVRQLARAYFEVLTHPVFFLTGMAMAFGFNGFFLYVLSAPEFLLHHIGLTETQFGLFFIQTVVGSSLGAMMAGRLAGRRSAMWPIKCGFSIMIVAAALNFVISALLPPSLLWSIIPIAVYSFGMAMTMPSLSLVGLDLFPTRRGMASSCQSFLQVAFNAVTAGLLAPLLWHTPRALALGMGLLLMLSLSCFWFWRWRDGKTE